MRENIELPLIFARKPVNGLENLLGKVGLKGKDHLRANMISAGDKQMTCIARALINDPKIIIADEPTGKLETREGDLVMNMFRELAESNLAIVIATHDLGIADRSDRIIHLQDGKIVSS